jgi:hypothetical protein
MRFNECKKKNYLRVKRGYIGAYHECAWPFPNREETRTRHQYDTDDISPAHRAAYELKRWLHGFKSIYDTKKEVAKQAVRRRIIKNKVTKSDLDFFKTIYGVSQVGRWIKEAQNKQKHEHTSN